MNVWMTCDLNEVRGYFMWNVKPSGKVMNVDVESCNGILQVRNDWLKVDWFEPHHIEPYAMNDTRGIDKTSWSLICPVTMEGCSNF